MKRIKIVTGYIILIASALTMVFPFIWMLYISLSNPVDIFSNKIILDKLNIDAYKQVTGSINIAQYFLNSMIVAVITTIAQVIIATTAGFAFARLNYKYKDILFFIILATMMVPPQVNIIPLFFLFSKLHLIDTYVALILPGIVGGFGIFMMRQAFKSLPKDLEEAAKIDGCSIYKTFGSILLPLVLPFIVTLAIFTFITTWNSFMWPLIVTNSDSLRTLPVGLATFKGSFRETIEWTQLMACSVISIIPVLVVFLAGKKYFINDILSGSVKE